MSKMSWTVCATFQHLEWLATFLVFACLCISFLSDCYFVTKLHRMPGAARHLGPYVMPRAQHDEHHVLCGDPKIEHVSKLRNSGQKPEHWSHPVSGWWGGANCLHNILVVGLCSWPWAESCWDCLPFRPQGHTFRWADRSRSEVPLGQFHAPGRGTCVCSFLFLYKALDQLLHRWARCCLPSLFFAWVWLAADAWQLILACQFWMMIWKLAMGSKKNGKQVLPHLTHLPMLFMSCHALTHVRWHSMHVEPCHAIHTEVKTPTLACGQLLNVSCPLHSQTWVRMMVKFALYKCLGRIMLCKGYDVLSYPMYGRTCVRTMVNLWGWHTLCTAEPASNDGQPLGVTYPLYGRTCVRTMVNLWGDIPFVRPNLHSNDGQPLGVTYPLYGRTCVRTMVNLWGWHILCTAEPAFERWSTLEVTMTRGDSDVQRVCRCVIPYVRPNPGSGVQTYLPWVCHPPRT